MQIRTTKIQPSTIQGAKTPPPAAKPEADSTFGDSFTSSIDVKSGLFFGALGFVPLVGALANFGSGMESGFNDNQKAATAAGMGAVSNIIGTGVAAGGLIFGNSIATNVGLGMLGISGLTAAYAGFC